MGDDVNNLPVLDVKVERGGVVLDASGAKIGTLTDPTAGEHDLACFAADLVDAAHGRIRLRGRDPKLASRLMTDRAGKIDQDFARLLAGNAGDLAIRDVATAATRATYIQAPLEATADIVCPVTLVSTSYGSWLQDNVSTDVPNDTVDQGGSAGGSPTELNPQLSNTPYDATSSQALAVTLPAELFANPDIDLEKFAIRRLVNAFKLRREQRVVKLLTTSTNFLAANRVAAAAKWDQAFAATTATPIIDVFAAMQPSLYTPTHIVFTEALAHYFFANPQVYQFLTAIGESQSRVFPEVVIGTMRNTQGGTVNYLWGAGNSANAVLVYAPTDQPEAVATSRTLRFIGDAPDTKKVVEANGFMLRKMFDARRGPKGAFNYVLVANDVEVMLNNQLGAIITGAGA